MKYKSTAKFYLPFIFLAFGHEFILDIYFETKTLSQVLQEIYGAFKYPALLFTVPYLFLIFSILGGFCKSVIETEDSYKVIAMFGLINYDFKKEEIKTTYKDNKLFNPGGSPYIVSNEHILITNGRHKTIIYPIGTRNFDKLKIKLNKLQQD